MTYAPPQPLPIAAANILHISWASFAYAAMSRGCTCSPCPNRI